MRPKDEHTKQNALAMHGGCVFVPVYTVDHSIIHRKQRLIIYRKEIYKHRNAQTNKKAKPINRLIESL